MKISSLENHKTLIDFLSIYYNKVFFCHGPPSFFSPQPRIAIWLTVHHVPETIKATSSSSLELTESTGEGGAAGLVIPHILFCLSLWFL